MDLTRPPSSKLSNIVAVVTAIAAALPLWTVRYIPGTDLPSHLAIASILAKLVAHDPVISQHYAINLQPVPYYLVYMLLAPLVALAGPFVAAKIFCSGIAVATVLAARRLFDVIAAPWWATTSAVFLAYGMIFFWGFLPTLVGVPLFIYGLSHLVEVSRFERRGSVIAAGAVGFVLMLTHIALLIPWACALVALWCTGKRRVIRASLVAGLTTVVPLVPFVVVRLLAGHRSGELSVQYEDAGAMALHLGQQFAVFDRGLGCSSHVAFVLVTAAVALSCRRAGTVDAATKRMLAAFAGLSAIAYAATPMAMSAGGDAIWAFNVRLFFAVEIGLIAWLTFDRAAIPRVYGYAQTLLAGAHVATLIAFFAAFDSHVRAAEPVLAAIPDGATVAIASKDGRYGDAWAPLTLHIHGYYLAEHSGYDGAVFAGKHIPISDRHALCPGNMDGPRPTACTYLFAEGVSVAPALRNCLPVAVSGRFALVRNCRQADAPAAAELVAGEPAPNRDATGTTDDQTRSRDPVL